MPTKQDFMHLPPRQRVLVIAALTDGHRATRDVAQGQWRFGEQTCPMPEGDALVAQGYLVACDAEAREFRIPIDVRLTIGE